MSSPTSCLTLELDGDLIPVPAGFAQPATNPAVCLELFVYEPHDLFVYPTVEFPLSRLPELRQQIGLAISSYGQSVIRSDDHEVFEFLTDHVTSYLNNLMERRPSAQEDARILYLICASLLVEDQAPGSGPGEATEAAPSPSVDLMRLLRKVTYRNTEEEENGAATEMVTETSCPICLQEFVEGEEVHVTPCGHPFHLLCLQRSLQRKQKCPLCRTPIP